MSFGYSKFIDTDIFKILKFGTSIIPLKMFLLDLLDCIPTHMKEIGYILDCTDMGKRQYQTRKTVRVGTLPVYKMQVLVTDTATILAFYTLNLNIHKHLFATYGYITYATDMRTGTVNMTTFTLRTNKFILKGLDFKDNTIIFVAYSGAFLFTDA